MSYLSLLFSLPMWGMSSASAARREPRYETFTEPDAAERGWTNAVEDSVDYPLPSGIASMEHWLDLNA